MRKINFLSFFRVFLGFFANSIQVIEDNYNKNNSLYRYNMLSKVSKKNLPWASLGLTFSSPEKDVKDRDDYCKMIVILMVLSEETMV